MDTNFGNVGCGTLQIAMDAGHADDAGLSEMPKTAVDTEKILPTREELERELERQKKKYKRFSNTVKYIFRNEWKEKMEEWKADKLALRELRKEEAELEGTLELLKKSVREIGGKDDEIQKLKERITKLEEARERPAPNATEGQGKEVSKSKGKDAVAILPEEIWKMILLNISEPNDLWNCYNTCQLFEDLLHDWKTSWVFEQTLPYFYRYLPGQALLKCRTICSGWLSVVDNLLGDHPSLRPYSDSPSPDPRRLEFVNPLKETEVGWRNEYVFSNDGNVPLEQNPDIQDFPCKNVFMGRNVIMKIGKEEGDEDGSGQQLWDRVNRFLTAFGKDIWYLNVLFPYTGWSQFEGHLAVAKVIEFLTVDVFHLVPNLRQLTVDQMPGTSDVFIQPNYPRALNLETINVFDGDDPEPLITSLFTNYHAQLRQLHVNYSNWQDVCHLEWPNLSELHIDAIHLEDFGHFHLELKDILGLRKLGLKIAVNTFDEYASALVIIHEVISTTRLSALRLQFNFEIDEDDLDDDDEFGGFIADLEAKTDYNLFVSPTLKTIEIELDQWARSYNFLLRYFPLIENLHVFRRRTEDDHREKFRSEMDLLANSEETRSFKWTRSIGKSEEMIEINKYVSGREMYKSNIWELFPRLKVFTFQWDVYTRGGYKEYLEALETSKN